MQELKGIIERLKKGKAPGPDDITTELLMDIEDEHILEGMLEMINQWWTSGEIPDDITIARVVSIYEKGNPDLQENYRPISLSNTFYKIMVQAMVWRLSEALDKKTMKSQYGFRVERARLMPSSWLEGYKNQPKEKEKEGL